MLRADRGAIVVYPPQSKAPCMTVTRTRKRGEPAFAVSTSVLSQVMIGHEPYLRTEIDDDVALSRSESLSAHGVRSVMAVPLRYQADETEWLGVIQLDSRAHVNVFGPRDLELLNAIAGPTSLAIKNSLLVRQVQSVISEEGRRVERVVRGLPVGVVVLDNERRCVLVNRWIAERADVVGELRVGAEVTAIAGVTCDVLAGDARHHEVTVGERVLSIAATTSADANETVIVVSDVTAERERQHQTAHRDRVALLGQLAGGIAHDFNNLLVVILNYAHLLEETLEDPEARDDAHQISHAATSAAELTRQLLTFTRRELVKTRVVDVAAVVRGMTKMLERTLGTVELVANIVSSAHALIDGSQLEQILMNLVVNARDAMPDGGRVALTVNVVEIDEERASRRAIPPGRYVAIEVRDGGTGMQPDVMARIFEPYFTTKARGQGTGLGLATVYGLVQQARGDIVVESTLGEGTAFRIYLPETDRIEGAARLAPVANRAITILVVDDDDSVRRLTERMLKTAGYQV
ncbi:MAG: ATP-binding protein, partial [Kofleriaceae bacterium]